MRGLLRLLGSAASAALVVADFVHPGVFVGRTQLDFVRQQIAARADPIWSAYLKANASVYGALDYVPQGPPASGTIECGSYSHPDYGCSAEDADGSAAYLQAVLYHLTGVQRYATNAVRILNAYGHGLKKYSNSNAPLQAAWGASKWARAAELTLHSGAGWADADVQQFVTMFKEVSLPLINHGSPSNGNWHLSMLEGTIGIAVFTNDTSLYNYSIDQWMERMRAYWYSYAVYGDHHPPSPPQGNPSWYGMDTFNASSSGVCQETCRDLGHTSYSISAVHNFAETAYIQGLDLYSEHNVTELLTATLEFHANFLLGARAPEWLCGGKLTLRTYPTFEVGYNAFANRMGIALPITLEHLQKDVRPMPDLCDPHMIIYETLTHGGSHK